MTRTLFHGFTIIDVFRHLNVEPNKRYTWPAGLAMMNLYYEREGRQPYKDNRPKTNGEGVHCFAIYPEEYWNDAVSIVQGLKAEAAKQMDMFA